MLAPADGTLEGAWIERRLGGLFGAVTLHVPKGYAAYARLFHPALNSSGDRVRWAEVAEASGTVAHREMQWHSLLGSFDPVSRGRGNRPKWSGLDPSLGAMDLETLDALCEILVCHTTDAQHIYFGLSTIEGWAECCPTDELRPLLKLPNDREYVILTGSLHAVDEIVVREGGSVYRAAPNPIWPESHAWFVCSEVDFDSTLVGGPKDLIRSILHSPLLESWEVEPTDSLAADADKVNTGSERERG